MIGGNIELQLQTKTSTVDEIGAGVSTWKTVQKFKGWFDYTAGESGRANYDAKIQETTHLFICDYEKLKDDFKDKDCRAIANGRVYDVLLIDDPMEMHMQYEIYLKYTGGQER